MLRKLSLPASIAIAGLLISALPAIAGVSNADLAVTKTDGVATAVPGTQTVYTIVATNNGPSDDPAVTVTDTFPPILSCTWTCTASAGSSCTAAGSGNINDSANLLNGGTATYTATCDIDPSATGTLDNTVTVTSSVTDPNSANNSATDSDTLIPEADISITKDDGAASSVPGTQVTYSLVATNNGPSDATGVTVTDTFPASLSSCTWTCAASAGSSCTAAGAGNIGDSIDLLAGGTATYSATCDIDSAATGTLDNTATVSSGIDPNAGNDSATDSNSLTPEADLEMLISINPDPVPAGSMFTIDVTVVNHGPSDATTTVVNITLPPGFAFGSTTGCVEDPNGVPTCTLGTIPAGQNAAFSIQATATTVPGDHPMIAGMSSDATDPNPGNDGTGTILITVTASLPIPTLGFLGLSLLSLLLVGAAFWTLRR